MKLAFQKNDWYNFGIKLPTLLKNGVTTPWTNRCFLSVHMWNKIYFSSNFYMHKTDIIFIQWGSRTPEDPRCLPDANTHSHQLAPYVLYFVWVIFYINKLARKMRRHHFYIDAYSRGSGLLYKMWRVNYFSNDELHIILKFRSLKTGDNSSFFLIIEQTYL